MSSISINGIGIVTIPERNTTDEIITIVNTLKGDFKTLNELLEIVPHTIFWCEHEQCLEVIEPFKSEKDLNTHMCKCHESEEFEVCNE